MRTSVNFVLSSCAATALLAGCGASQPPIGTPGAASNVQQAHSHRLIFKYTGAEQALKVPTGVTLIKVDALGAAGAGTPNSYHQEGGHGGRVLAELPVNPGDSLTIFVGGTANVTSGGYNGGGNGTSLSTVPSYGGGGATDIREGGKALDDRILVAGGGGGLGGAADGYAGGGGEGGYRIAGKGNNGGGNITRHCHSFGHGASAGSQQHGGRGGRGAFGRDGACRAGAGAAGELGVGGKGGGGDGGGGGGGGGGYYGGGGGGGGMFELDPQHIFGNGGGGGGGSSFVEPSAQNVRNWKGWKDATGNGQLVISW